jgi:hypothetical protein
VTLGVKPDGDPNAVTVESKGTILVSILATDDLIFFHPVRLMTKK